MCPAKLDEDNAVADIIFRGLKRSGNHAVINWIRENRNYDFVNNIAPIGRYLDQELPKFDIGYLRLKRALRKIYLERNFDGFRLHQRIDLLVSVEDTPPDYIPFRKTPKNLIEVNLIRSFENILASRIKKAFAEKKSLAFPDENNSYMSRFVDLWISYAEGALGPHKENLIWIYYDRWLSDSAYRTDLTRRLGNDLSEGGLSRRVSRFGGGSSFSGVGEISNFDSLRDRKSMLIGKEAALFEEVFSKLNPKIRPLMERLAAI